MAEDLQNLLERIQKDGVDKARREADSVLAEARRKAEGLLAEAEEKAAARLRQAEEEAELSARRGERSLRQAARDVVLSVGEAVNRALSAVARDAVAETLDPEVLADLLKQVVEAYVGDESGTGRLDVLLNPEQQEAVRKHLLARFGGAMREGIELKADGTILSGFRVALRESDVEHTFTAEAIAAALCELVRPELAAVIRQAGEAPEDTTEPAEA